MATEQTTQMTRLERLARAVLLFHRGGPWTGTERNEWVMLTGEEEATTRVLCNLARRLAEEAVYEAHPLKEVVHD